MTTPADAHPADAGDARKGARTRITGVVQLLLAALLVVSAVQESDPVDSLQFGALATWALLSALGRLRRSPGLSNAGALCCLVYIGAVFTPGTVERVLGIPTLDDGTYTLTITVERSEDARLPVGEHVFTVALDRDDRRLSGWTHERGFVSGRLTGSEVSFWVSAGAEDMLWLDGACDARGRASGRARTPSPRDEEPAIDGRFTLALEDADP